jgi:beta-aspartyl-peptidase (threonine type)
LTSLDGITVAETGRLRPPVLLVHGGAGRRDQPEIDPDRQQAWRNAVDTALATGTRLLASGADARTTAVETVAVLEDTGVLNAGRGAVRTSTGSVELDAAVMEGATRRLGAVAGVGRVRNPVRAADAVLAEEAWAFLAGPEADTFALAHGCEAAPPDWFLTRDDSPARDASVDPVAGDTVGAVVVDTAGRTAAATSTGGVPEQVPGRVGDSPVAGAGLWADDQTCAVSGTGLGESFLRAAAAHHVHMRLAHPGPGRPADLLDACRSALAEILAVGGYGGLIAVTPAGDHALVATTPLFIRGVAAAGKPPSVSLFAGPDRPGPPQRPGGGPGRPPAW